MSIGSSVNASSSYSENTQMTATTFQLVEENTKIDQPYSFEFLEHDYIGLPQVYSHKLFLGGFIAHKFPFKSNGSFLEIGTGTGVYAIHAALKGAEKVVATDINPESIKNAKINAIYHGVEHLVDVRAGSIFTSIHTHEKFDIIFWNIPIGHTETRELSVLQQAVFDPDYKLMKDYLCKGSEFLSTGGMLLMAYSKDIGDLYVMKSIAHNCGLVSKVLYEEKEPGRPSIELYSFLHDQAA